MWTFWVLHYKVADGVVIIKYILHLCGQSFTFQQEHIFLPSENCFPFSLPCSLWCSAFEFLVIGKMLSSQTSFLKGPQVMIISRCEIRSVGWIWQHCPSKICIGLCGAHPWAWSDVAMGELPFRHLSYGTNSMKTSIQTSLCLSLVVRVYRCLPRKKYARITPLLSKKTAAVIFSATYALQFWPCTIDLIPSDFHLFGPVKETKEACEDAITPVTRYCKMVYISGCGG